jgi:hypothetical protein
VLNDLKERGTPALDDWNKACAESPRSRADAQLLQGAGKPRTGGKVPDGRREAGLRQHLGPLKNGARSAIVTRRFNKENRRFNKENR